jgi:hypothetical protein
MRCDGCGLGEGVGYCADHRLSYEERSDAYWEVVEHAARTYPPWRARIPARKTQFGASTPSVSSEPMPCSWASSRDVH